MINWGIIRKDLELGCFSVKEYTGTMYLFYNNDRVAQCYKKTFETKYKSSTAVWLYSILTRTEKRIKVIYNSINNLQQEKDTLLTMENAIVQLMGYRG